VPRALPGIGGQWDPAPRWGQGLPVQFRAGLIQGAQGFQDPPAVILAGKLLLQGICSGLQVAMCRGGGSGFRSEGRQIRQ